MYISRIFYTSILFLVAVVVSKAQVPEIYSINPVSNIPTEKIQITGKNFGITGANISILFGAMVAETPIVIRDNYLEVKVPAGAIHKPVTIIRKDLKLSGSSSANFLPSFGGTGIDNVAFLNQSSANTLAGVNDFAVGDLDLDGKIDIVMANTANNAIAILVNNSTAIGTIAFKAITQLSVNAPTDHISLADLDGDGRLDIIATEFQDATYTGDKIFIFRNISAPGSLDFEPFKTVTISGFNAKRTEVSDLDLDGKPDIVVTNHNGASFAILKNQVSGSILATSFLINKIEVDSVTKTSCVIIRDLNNDRFPDVVISEDQKNNVQVYQNRSNTGKIVFDRRRSFLIAGTVTRISISDFNNDNKPDIVVTKQETGNVTVLANTTQKAGELISFSQDQLNFSTVLKPWGLDAGDVDGDGRTDLVVASLSENRISILRGNGLSSAEFERRNISISETTRNAKLADLDGDGKPDIILSAATSSKLYFLRNNNCFIPAILNGTTATSCTSSYRIESARGLGITNYEWRLNGTSVATGINSIYDATQSGTYTVTATGPDGCIKTSRNFSLTLSTASAPLPPTVTANQTICAGNDLILTVASSGSSFKWEGPGKFSSATSPVTIAAANTELSGLYTVRRIENGCESTPANVLVIIKPYTSVRIETASPTTCSGKTITLNSSVTNNLVFQWRKDNSAIAGATSASYTTGTTATESGTYSLAVTNLEGCLFETDPLPVNIVTQPVPEFEVSRNCIGQPTQFTDKSVISSSVQPDYFWMFGDLGTAGVANPVHQYKDPGTFAVRLRVSYGADCMNEITKNVEIKFSPPFSIIHGTDTTLCPGESLKLASPELFTNPIWSNGLKTAEIEVKLPGTYSISALSPEGCEVYDDVNIVADPAPLVSIVAEKNTIKEGETVKLTASGASTYVWSPADLLNNHEIADPVAKPIATTSFAVTGTSTNGCTGTDAINIIVDASLDVDPSKLFTPNDDTKNDFWKIDKIELYPDCQVSIYTREGQKIFEAKPYPTEGWNGTHNGKNLNSGVYFFVIRCNGINKNKTGSVMLVR